MNILGFVAVILLSLAYVMSSFEKKDLIFRKLQKNYASYFQASRSLQNSFEQMQYRLSKAKPKKNSETKKKPQEKQNTPVEKLENMPYCARVNLQPLFTEEKSPLKPFVLKLLQSLYGKTLFEGENHLSEKILDSLILSAKENLKENPDHPLHLAKLHLENDDLQFYYYFLLKGTKKYSEDEGLYPFLEYVKLEKTPQKICVSCADKKMLSVLFSPKVAEIIWEKKETDQERLSIKKEEVESYLLKERIEIDPNLWNFLSFTHKNTKNEHVTVEGKDLSKDITLKNTISITH